MRRRPRIRSNRERRTRVDLHMHTVASDGHGTSASLLKAAAEGRLDAIAITDHDLPPTLAPGAHQVGGRQVWVVSGVEVSTMYEDQELHLLVYFPNAIPDDFAAWCTGRARWRAEWFDASMEAIGIEARADAQAREGRRSLTRVHMARALVDAGVAPDLQTAFRGWIGHDAHRIPPIELGFLDALSIARDAGGWTSWAHPQPAHAETWASGFAAAGLHALEAWRPTGGKHRRESLFRLAHRNGMSITGGSDHHGGGGRRLGSFAVPLKILGSTRDALELSRCRVASM